MSGIIEIDKYKELNEKLSFIQFHKPPLTSGDYILNVEQKFKAVKDGKTIINRTSSPFSARQIFSVRGNRFQISPADIHSVYPPKGGSGDYYAVVPHIVLNRSTLPWEREPYNVQGPESGASWLALLLFDENEAPEASILSFEDLEALESNKPWWDILGGIDPEGESPDDKVTTIKVDKSLLDDIAPSYADLEYLSHIRLSKLVDDFSAYIFDNVLNECSENPDAKKGFFEDQNITEDPEYLGSRNNITNILAWYEAKRGWTANTPAAEKYEDEIFTILTEQKDPKEEIIGGQKATILCNRLPKPGYKSTVHLVSLEGRYKKNTDGIVEFNDTGSEITLVSLHSWSFYTTRSKGNFKEILEDIKVGTMRLPDNDENANSYINKGFVPLRHEMRYGQKTVSWYHGPFSPANLQWPTAVLPARSADELLHYNPQNGLFDVSYAAAWELGRKLALEDNKFSMALFHWKKELAMNMLTAAQLADIDYISVPGTTDIFNESPLGKAEAKLLHGDLSPRSHEDHSMNQPNVHGIPVTIENFFYHLRRLEGIPFHYLVPDDAILPEESIRFFRIDPVWMDCLLDGAYSLGDDAETRVTSSTGDEHHHSKITGFILRSEVVRGWPGMLINAYSERLIKDEIVFNEDLTKAKADKLLPIVRSDYLAEDILLLLFEGDLQTVDFFLARDTLHFGLDIDDDEFDGGEDDADEITGQFWQVLRNKEGIEQDDDESMKIKAIPFRDPGKDLVIDISDLAVKIENTLQDAGQLNLGSEEAFFSAHFALQMMEGSEKVRILRKQ